MDNFENNQANQRDSKRVSHKVIIGGIVTILVLIVVAVGVVIYIATESAPEESETSQEATPETRQRPASTVSVYAQASERRSDASHIARVAESYYAATGRYPVSVPDYAAARDARLPDDITVNIIATTPSGVNTITNDNGPTVSGETKIYIVQSCSDSARGGLVHYYDPRPGIGHESVGYGRGC